MDLFNCSDMWFCFLSFSDFMCLNSSVQIKCNIFLFLHRAFIPSEKFSVSTQSNLVQQSLICNLKIVICILNLCTMFKYKYFEGYSYVFRWSHYVLSCSR